MSATPGRQPSRTYARAAQAAKGHRGDRFAKLEQLERRCNADTHCTRLAMVEFELQMVHPETKEPVGDVQVKRVCTRERIKYEGGAAWQVLKTTELGPMDWK